MSSYHVIGPDGAAYGPADLPTLQAWAAHGRVFPNTPLRDVQTGQTFPAAQLPGLFPGGAGSPPPQAQPAPHAQPAPQPHPAPHANPGDQPAPQATLQVQFTPPRMLIDAAVEVFLNGQKIGEGNFNQGVDLSTPVHPGRHTLDVRLALRSRRYTVDIDRPGRYLCQLSYSRLWGNFDKTVRLSYQGE